jgi:class 3 adenylate cyclase
MAESQTATILVTDLVGSTQLRIQLGEERADELRRLHDRLLHTAIESNSGTVIKGLGDGVLAMFSGAADAVAAAVSIQRAAYAHNRSTPGEVLDIRIGLSSGDVSLEGGDCFGTPVVEASRLCGVALGGNILAADIVRLLARGRGGHVFTAAGERELKGLPDPVPVAVVAWEPPELEEGGVPFPARINPQSLLPFSGRDVQVEALLQAWKEATGGERRIVLVSGEPGIGKTRLSAEVARRVHDHGGVVLFGRCEEDMGMGYQPFVEALGQVLATRPRPEQLGRFAGELARLSADLSSVVPGLEAPVQSDPDTERYRLFDAIAAWLGAMSSSSGVLLILDDLHWAEKPTLLLLRHLVRSLEPMKLLVIGTYRDTDLDRTHPLASIMTDLRQEPTVSRLALTGLDVAGVTELLATAADQRFEVDIDQLAQLLWSETEGNPFFVQEVIVNLVESGRLVQRDGVWTTDLELTELGIPEGVRETVGRRLSRLSDAANTVLGLAAVIGSVVDVELLLDISDLSEEAVLDALDEVSAAGLLRETTSGLYEFTHALVRSTLYDEISATRRGRRHREVAEALERSHAPDPAALAFHFRRAGTVDTRAVDYAQAAGEASLRSLAFDQAVAFFGQALEAHEDTDGDRSRRCSLLVRLGISERLAGEPGFRDTLLTAAALAQELRDTALLCEAALANNRGFFSVLFAVDHERVAVLKAALEAIGPEDSTTRARLLALLALETMYGDPDLKRLELAEEAVAMARRLHDDRCLLEVWRSAQLSTWTPERVPQLAAEHPALLALAEQVGDAQELVYVCLWGICRSVEMDDHRGANTLLARLSQVVRDFNSPIFRWLEAMFRCTIMTIVSSGDDIEAAATVALQLGSDAGQPDAYMIFAAQLLFARIMQGRLAEIDDLIRSQVSDNPATFVWRCILACSLIAGGNEEEASSIVEELSTGRAHEAPIDFLWLMAQSFLADAIAQVGTAEQAVAQYEVLAPYHGRLPCSGANVLPSCTLYLAMLAARTQRNEVATQLFEEALAQHEAIGASIWLARTQLEFGRFLIGIGQKDHARAFLTKARDCAKRMGAVDIESIAGSLIEA